MNVASSKQVFFTWSDAWVFASLQGAFNETGQFSYSSLITAGDILNHAIMTNEEIKDGLIRLYTRGLLEIDRENIKVTKLAKKLYVEIEKKQGGLFSVVDNCLEVLNSPRAKLPYIKVDAQLEIFIKNFSSRQTL
jgi:hypothetical protein